MAAKDESTCFDFAGVCTSVRNHELIESDIDDGWHVKVEFAELAEGVRVTETFEPEKINREDMRRPRWQAHLDNFKKIG